ncbi:MAG: translocation/assembly module TamB domain-containing protein [Gemmatimonadota bacterium]|nr:translocation/assembly module TamB domain-containing protein [Gemmatimonadota bacterium]
MKRKLLGAAVLAAVLVLVAVTPIGPAALAHLLERGVGGWQISIGSRRGGLLYAFSFSDVYCKNPALGVTVNAEYIAAWPWSWEVDIQAPKVRIEPGTGADSTTAATDIELPLAFLPNLNAKAGALDWQLGETRIWAQDWRGAYRAVADTSGHLELTLSELQGVPLRSLTLDLALSPHRIDRGEIRAVGAGDSLRSDLHASFSLGMKLPRPLQMDATATVETDSARGSLAAEIDGALTPLQLRGTLRGKGSAPTTSAVDLRGDMRANSTRLVVDSLLVSLFDGTLTGEATYFFTRDSLQTQLRGEGFDLALAAPFAGRAEFDLAAGVQLQHQRYAADFAALLRDVDLIPDRQFDAEITGWHQPDGATRLDLQSPVLDLIATGSSDLEGDYDLALKGALQAASFLRGAAPIAIAGQAKPDTLALRLTTSHLPGELGEEFGPLAADLHLSANRYLAADLRLERDLLVARADIDLKRSEIDTLVAAVNGLAVERIMPGLSGRLDADLRGAGGLSLDELRLAGRAATTPLEYAGWQTGELALNVGWDQGAARVAGTAPGVSVLAELDVDGHLTAQADFADTLLRGADGAVAALGGTLRWEGPLEDLDAVQADLALDSLLLRQGEWELQNYGALQADYGDGRMDFTAVHLQTSVGLVDLSGWVGRDSLSVAAELSALELSNLASDLSATGGGHLRVGGTLARPEAQGVVTMADMHLDTLALGNARLRLSLADTLKTEFTADAGMRLALTCPAAPLFGPGAAPARLAIEAKAADLGPVLSYALGRPLYGRLDLDGYLEAALGDSMPSWRDLSGHIDVQGLAIESRASADSLRLALLSGGHFAFGEGRVVLDSVAIGLRRYDRDRLAHQPAGSLRLAGQLEGTKPSKIELALKDADLAFFGGPKGLVQLDAEVRGTTSAPQVTAELAVETADLGKLRGQLVGDRHGGDWHLNWTTLPDDSLTVTGRVPWDLQAGELSLDESWLEAHSDGIGLLFLGDLIAELDHLDGRISTDLRAEGLDSTLSLQGQIGVKGLEFALLDLEPIYALPDGQLQFNDRQVELVGFSVEKEPKRGFHSASLTGQFDLSRLDDPSFDLQLQAERMTSSYEDVGQSFRANDIDLDLSFAGSLSASKLAGRIRIDRPKSEASLVVLALPVPPPPPALRDDFLENMALAVEIDLRGLALDSELAEVEASGAVEVGGTFYKPLFQGDITIDEGQVFVLNQEFNITQGRVVFNRLAPTKSILDVMYDPFELNPTLDLQAKVEDIPNIKSEYEYDVTLTLKGSAQKIVPDFEADSEDPNADPIEDPLSIVNLLVFNMADLDVADLDYDAAVTAAGQLLSKQVEKEVGLDEFTVLPSSEIAGAEPGDPALRVGEYFSRRLPLPLWVRYEAPLKEMASGEVRIEHKVKSFLIITGSAQSKYDHYGLGIGLKREFR